MSGHWSVRELEQRARGGEPGRRISHPRRSRAIHPDQQAAIERISDSLAATLGLEVEVTAAGGGYRAHMSFGSLDEALEWARRLSMRAAA